MDIIIIAKSLVTGNVLELTFYRDEGKTKIGKRHLEREVAANLEGRFLNRVRGLGGNMQIDLRERGVPF